MYHMFRQSLHKIDIFGQTITLNMNQQAQYTTEFGGISSFLIIVVVILFFFSNILDFLSKSQVTASDETIFFDDPTLLELSRENYMAAFAIEQSNFTTYPFFNISIEQRQYQRSLDGSINKSVTYIQLQKCKFEQFDRVFSKQGIDFTEQFNTLGLENWLCPPDDYKFSIQGTYASETFQFIKIVVQKCQNDTDRNASWNPTCASQETVDQYLLKNGKFKLQIYQTNSIINANKPEEYLKYFLDSDMYFTFVPYKLSRQANIYFRDTVIVNDESLLPVQDIDKKSVVIRKNEDFRDLTELGRDTDDSYSIIYLRKSPFSQTVSRHYQKLGELLSYLGGVVQILKLVFGLAIVFINRQLMLIELCNKLYDFTEGRQQRKVVSDLNQNSPGIPQETNRSKFVEDQLNSPEPDLVIDGKNGYQSTSQLNLKGVINSILYDSKPIKVTFKLILHQLTFGYFFKDNNATFLDKALTRMNQDLDLHSILYRIQEISKIKKILFNQNQLILFNFTPKPQIQLYGHERIPSRLIIHELKSNSKKKLTRQDNIDFDVRDNIPNKLMNAYQYVKDDFVLEEQNNCLLKLNQKLIELMHKETSTLETSYRNNYISSPKRTYLYSNDQQNELNQDQIDINSANQGKNLHFQKSEI